MGILGNFGKSLFGGYGYSSPGWARDAGKQAYGNFSASLADMYSPEAYRRAVSRFAGDFDNTLESQGAKWNGTMASRGFGGGGGQGVNLGLIRAGSLAEARTDIRDRFDRGRLEGYGRQADMLRGLAPLYERTYQPGAMGAIGSLYGMYQMGRQPQQQNPQWDSDGDGYPGPLQRPEAYDYYGIYGY